jgi:flagellar basal-body rod protein FlgF
VIHIGTNLAFQDEIPSPRSCLILFSLSPEINDRAGKMPDFRQWRATCNTACVDSLLISAASGMKARMESLDMLANNIANTGTAGFKTDREFYGLYQKELPVIEKQWTDFSQGVLTPSGNPLDLGLSGKGFFALNSPTGVVYTRNGQFQISKSNQLQTLEGFTLRNSRDQGKPIVIDPAQAIDIDKAGVIRQGGQEIAQIELGGMDDPSAALKKLGNSYFAMLDPSRPAGPAKEAEIQQGTVEQSNVPVADAAVRLVSVMRQFEMLQRAMSVGAEMNKQAVEEVARVS